MVITLNSSNPKSERYFWLNSDFNEGNIKYKNWRTDSCESILRFSDPNFRKFELFREFSKTFNAINLYS